MSTPSLQDIRPIKGENVLYKLDEPGYTPEIHPLYQSFKTFLNSVLDDNSASENE